LLASISASLKRFDLRWRDQAQACRRSDQPVREVIVPASIDDALEHADDDVADDIEDRAPQLRWR
jgi:hypothetical protein